MWSIGCIAAELLLRTPLLQGTSDLDQLSKTFEVLGSPTKENWPDVDQLPDYVEFRPSPGFPLEEIFSAAGDDLIHLLKGLFALDPKRRLTSTQCLSMKILIDSVKPFKSKNRDKIYLDAPNPNLKKVVIEIFE